MIIKELGIRVYWGYDIRLIVCYIVKLSDDSLLSAIGATCSKKDRYIKETGRRISLAKALRTDKIYTYFHMTLNCRNEDEIRKIRGQVWEAYRTMTKKPRW